MPFKEQELMLAQEVAGLATWEWNLETNDLRWLPGSAPVFGKPVDELRSQNDVLECIHPEDRENVNSAVQRALENGGHYDYEFRVRWPNGEIHWIHSRGRLVERPGIARAMIGVAQDVSAIKWREKSLEAQARLLELAHEPILVRDAEDRITYWNNGAERLYGYSSREAAQQRSHDLLCTKFPEPLQDIKAKFEAKGYWEGELIHCTKDQRLIHVASRWQRFSNDGVSTLETNFDLSQHKALQVAKLWEEKAKLLGELSHQINNPLAAATNAAYMLRNGCEEPVQQYMEILQESIDRIADFIKKTNELHHTARSEEDLLQQRIGGRLQQPRTRCSHTRELIARSIPIARQ